MPIVAAIPAVIGAGASIYAASQANKGIQKGIDAQQQATAQTLALQERMFNQTRADQAPYREAGYQGIDAILAQYGLGQPQAGQPDWDAYLAANPDVMAWAQSGHGDPNIPIDQQSIQQRAAYHYQNSGQSEGRQLPTVQAGQQAPTGEQQLQAQIGEEPSFAPRQDYVRPGYAAPNVSLDDFQASPDYQFRLNEGSRNLNAFNAARGVTGSGAAAKALVDYGQNTAAAEYGDFFNRQLGLSDRQNSFNQNAFESDRQYGTGVYDADRNFATSRYDTNRNYLTSRADARTNSLFRLASGGQGAAQFTNQQGQAYANNVGDQLNTNANVLSNAYGQKANNNVALTGQLTGYLQNAFSNWFPSKAA